MKLKDKLKSIFTYHVVSGKHMAKDVVTMKLAETVNGQSFMVNMDSGKVMVDTAKVVKTDIECSNGVIHVMIVSSCLNNLHIIFVNV